MRQQTTLCRTSRSATSIRRYPPDPGLRCHVNQIPEIPDNELGIARDAKSKTNCIFPLSKASDAGVIANICCYAGLVLKKDVHPGSLGLRVVKHFRYKTYVCLL